MLSQGNMFIAAASLDSGRQSKSTFDVFACFDVFLFGVIAQGCSVGSWPKQPQTRLGKNSNVGKQTELNARCRY
jgi:hypothetical protein